MSKLWYDSKQKNTNKRTQKQVISNHDHLLIIIYISIDTIIIIVHSSFVLSIAELQTLMRVCPTIVASLFLGVYDAVVPKRVHSLIRHRYQ